MCHGDAGSVIDNAFAAIWTLTGGYLVAQQNPTQRVFSGGTCEAEADTYIGQMLRVGSRCIRRRFVQAGCEEYRWGLMAWAGPSFALSCQQKLA